jgi:hypothetical protein
MKYISKALLITGILLFFLVGKSDAQKKFKIHKHPTNKWHQHHLMYINNIRVTGMLGLSSYYGDLCDQVVCFRYRPGISVGGYYRYNSRISFRGDLTYLRLSGTDQNGTNKTRNLSFRSPMIELAGGIMYDLLYFDRNYNLRPTLTPYVFLEVGGFYYNPRAEYQGKWYSLRPLMTEGHKYSSVSFAIPFGGGVRYKINSIMDLSFEMAYRKTFTDYLDDISTNYVSQSSFSNPVAAALADRTAEGGYYNGAHWDAGHKRGDPHKKDGYFIFGFKFEYMLKTTTQLHTINTMPRFRHRNPGMHRKYR